MSLYGEITLEGDFEFFHTGHSLSSRNGGWKGPDSASIIENNFLGFRLI